MSEQATTNENVVLTITVGSTPGVVAVGPDKPTDGSPVWFDTTDPERVVLKIDKETV